jgi:transposase-like protein
VAQHFLISAASRTISLRAVLRMDDDEAWATFNRLRWPKTNGDPVCPHCGGYVCYDVTRGASPRYRCKACRKDFSPTSGTLFAYHKLHVRDYLAAIVLFVNAVKGISSLQMARDLGVSAKAAWVLSHKIREAVASEMRGATVGGSGEVVEVDGAYFGGHIRPENRKADRKDRRLWINQNGKRRVVVVARERDGRAVTSVFRSEDEATGFIRSRVEAGTIVHTDEAKSWDELRERYQMERVNHSEAFSAFGACTNQAESYFARLRRAEWGQHHHISGAYLHRYAAEMAWREDHRRMTNGAHVARVSALVGQSRMSVDFTGRWQRQSAT